MVATSTRELAIKMSCTQSIESSESDKVNQIDEVGRTAIQEGESEEIEAKVSTRSEEEKAEKPQVEVKVKERAAIASNENSCLESKEEEIVVESFASLAGIEDVNEDENELKTAIDIETKGERLSEDSSEALKIELGDDKNSRDSTKKEDEEYDRFTKNETTMIEDSKNKSGQSDDNQAQSIENSNLSAQEAELNAINKETKEVEKVLEQVVANASEQNAEQTPAEQEQEKASKVCEKSEENVYDDYKEALASVANEQRRLNEQLSILSASLPPSPKTPISSASSASSADLPADVCTASGGSNVSSHEGEEVEGDNEDTSASYEEEEEEEGDYGDFCPESASVSTLRKLKMNTFKDIMVCEENHEAMEAARRLFDELARNGPKIQPAQSRNGSLDSSSSNYRNRNLSPAGSKDSSEQQEGDSAYDMKILRRSGSSISNSNSFRQTLVCSVSPIDKRSDNGSLSEVGYYESHPLYPIDGEEIKHCQTAFRENKRLIEERQKRAKLLNEERSTTTSCANSIINGNNNSSINSCYASGRWIRFNREFLEQASQSKCSRCNHRVYPTDKIELDFTRTKLNIHRNCFKCQICSTLLR